MKRLFTFTALSALVAAGAFAAPVSPEEALERLQEASGILPDIATRSITSSQLRYTVKSADNIPAIYVFDRPGDGFMILGADDITYPLLGFSDTGVFDPDNMPPALQGWLQNYQEQIEYMRLQGVTATAGQNSIPLPNWSPIQPMLKTTWDQRAPYDRLLPKINDSYCATGCVATSMAQVMNYFQYPERGKGKIDYQINLGSAQIPIYQTLSMDFGDTEFDWANMLDAYANVKYTNEQAMAVATLMKACGYSVQMNYSTNQSGAVSGYIPGALINYFNYDPSAMFISRSQKTYSEWAELIYNNLKNVGPVIYDGDTALMGGHSFVCDGYRGDGYFHFNWGWSGVSDGYFLLDALNPQALGTGGAAGGFNFRQDVVINIQKPKAGSIPTPDTVVLSGSVSGRTSAAYLYLEITGSDYTGFRYYGPSNIVFTLGAQIVEANNSNATPEYIEVTNTLYKDYPLDPGFVCFTNGSGQYPFPMIQLSKLDLKENVKYKVTTAYKPKNGDWEIATPSVGCYNYFYMTKTSKGYEFENFPIMEFDCTNLKLIDDLYDGVAAQLDITLTNPNNTELTRGVMLYLLDAPEYNANIMFYGDSFSQTLAPGASYTTTWTTPLTNRRGGNLTQPTDFYMALYDMDTATIYYIDQNPVRMNRYPGQADYTFDIIVEDQTYQNGVFVIDGPNFDVTSEVNVTKGIFSEDVKLYVLDNVPGTNTFNFVLTYPLDLAVVKAGETHDYLTQINFPSAEINHVYYLGILVGGVYQLACNPVPFKIMSTTGIEDIPVAETDGVINVYNLSGVKVLTTTDASALSSLPKGIYIINGKKVALR